MTITTNILYLSELESKLALYKELEDKLDALRQFKIEKTQNIEEAFFKDPSQLPLTMSSLTQLADAILISTYELARQELRNIYGFPGFKDPGGNYQISDFAIIGMGKLGGRELHFGSDLDLIFVFNPNGETQGKKVITNQEYFAKLAQRIINYLAVPTRYGYAYKIDTELRPSGNAGALVTCLDTWMSYYHEHAADWEKQALLKARLIYASGHFEEKFRGLFKRLIFLKPFSQELNEKIHHLRMRIEKELAKESPRRWDYKKGKGALIDIEFAMQYLQLKLGKIFDQVLTNNTLEAIDRFQLRKTLSTDHAEILRRAYYFYRVIEIFLEIKFKLREGYLDPEHECVAELAQLMSFENKENFLEYFEKTRLEVRETYLKILNLDS